MLPPSARTISWQIARPRPEPVALFPEGTTGPGDRLLPFRPTLLAAVTPPPPGVAVRPVAIDYGEAARDIGVTAKKIHELFPEGSGGGTSEAVTAEAALRETALASSTSRR